MLLGLANYQEMVLFFLLGTMGSLLPDIDSDNSIPIQVAFTFSSMLAAFSVMFSFIETFKSVAELIVIWLAIFLLFRTVVFALFTRFTTHRGIFHSIPAALFFCFATTIISYQLWQFEPSKAWMCGFFVAFGFIVHLLLDEIYSVNLFGMRSKKSLGTAFKFIYSKNWPATIYMYLVTLSLYFMTPTVGELAQLMSHKSFLTELSNSFLPQGQWFQF